MDRTIVTTAASPSGMAATAKETAIISVANTSSPVTLGYILNILSIKIKTEIPSTSQLNTLLSSFNFCCNGVVFSVV